MKRILALVLVLLCSINYVEAGLKWPRFKIGGKRIPVPLPLPIPIPVPLPGIPKLPSPIPGVTIKPPSIDGVPIPFWPTNPIEITPEIGKKCIEQISKCPGNILGHIGYNNVRPIFDSYRIHLNNQANGRWQPLPESFVSAAQSIYTGVNLKSVRYSTNINTLHGQAITIENSIFFPRNIDFSNYDDVEWMIHELEHVLQYQRKGGLENFIPEYLVKGLGKIIQKRSFNIHDFIDIERAAIEKARVHTRKIYNLMNGSPVLVENRCAEDVDLIILYFDFKQNRWVGEGTWSFSPGEIDRIADEDGDIVLKHSSIYFHAKSPSHTWWGNHRYQVDGKDYPMMETTLPIVDSGEMKLVIGCTIPAR